MFKTGDRVLAKFRNNDWQVGTIASVRTNGCDVTAEKYYSVVYPYLYVLNECMVPIPKGISQHKLKALKAILQ